MGQTVQATRKLRQNRIFILVNLSIGHGMVHWYQHALLVILPFVQATLGFGDVLYGVVGTVQATSSAVLNIPGGFVVDRLRHHWGPILAFCLVLASLSYVLLGSSLNYAFLLIAVIFVTLAGTAWHLPATAALSRRFPERRGFAISVDQVGAQIGNFIGPVVTGALLGLLLWRNIAFVYVAPGLVAAIVFWFFLRDLGRSSGDHDKKSLRVWFREVTQMAATPAVFGMVIVALLRLGALNALMLWVPRYLHDPVDAGGLGMRPFIVGLHFALLTGAGIASGPIMGLISDRFGRKIVLVPALLAATFLPIALVNLSSGPMLTLVMASLGLFTLSLQPIVLAAVLDIAGSGTEATAVGLLYGGGSAMAGISPLVAAFLINSFGLGAIFYYAAILTGLATVLMVFLPLKRPLQTHPAEGHSSKR